jgi:hypothetical protein
MSVRQIAAIGLCLLGTAAALSAQERGADIPSTFTRRAGEVWSEVGLRAVNAALLVEGAGQRSRVRLLTHDRGEVVIEGSTFTITSDSGKGVTIRSVGGATVTMRAQGAAQGRPLPGGRRMEADSVEVGIAPDGSGYFRAVRHPS